MNLLQKNKHGLSRTIPEGIKRKVRQRCGFGCVNCGIAVYQYEHFSPEFNDAKFHDPNDITLLCGGCHDRKTRGLLSVATVTEKNANPKSMEQGFSWGPFDVGTSLPNVTLGNVNMFKILCRRKGWQSVYNRISESFFTPLPRQISLNF